MKDHTKKSYDLIAKDYHLKRQDKAQNAWNEFLEIPAMETLLKPLIKKKQVLDLGCGTGILSKKIKSWGGLVVGLELSKKMVDIAQKENPAIKFTVGSATDLPYEEKTFNVVASSLVMHYLKDLSVPFKEVARVLKPKGRFIFSIHHPMNEVLKHNSDVVLVNPYFHNDKYLWKMCGVDLESYQHTFEDIINSLSQAGFVVEKIIECKPDPKVQEQFKDYTFTSNYPTFCLFQAALIS